MLVQTKRSTGRIGTMMSSGADFEQVVRGTYIHDLHLIPGNLELMEFEARYARALMQRKEGDTLFMVRI